jgi:hypothetical protein
MNLYIGDRSSGHVFCPDQRRVHAYLMEVKQQRFVLVGKGYLLSRALRREARQTQMLEYFPDLQDLSQASHAVEQRWWLPLSVSQGMIAGERKIRVPID